MKVLNLSVSPAIAETEHLLNLEIAKQINSSIGDFIYRIIKKSIDARKKNVIINLVIEVYLGNENPDAEEIINYKNVENAEPVHIIGAGPAGLFCALQCLELGLKPVIFERGKNVRDRRRDLAVLNKLGLLNEESNYCYGEGGAGTYSDGKLYTRSKKRGDVHKVLKWLTSFGADSKILYEAHPHIGTNKLPKIIESIRDKIEACGGKIYFSHKLTDLQISTDKINKIKVNEDWIDVKYVVLATGHSASDIYKLLHRHSIKIEAKPFALGVRVEHAQELINSIQYSCDYKDELLPPATYSLVENLNGRGVFSFCMCPGGIIAPASTHRKQLVVNGWSPSKRNNIFANSGMVVAITEKDFDASNPLAALQFQRSVEEKAYEYGGGNFRAPAQRLVDFINKKTSQSLTSCSYLPGVSSSNLNEVLPSFVYETLAYGFKAFGKKMKSSFFNQSYLTNEALVVATESRTSSPVRIPRFKDNLQHVQFSNLYPCAEGAGYAGGIISAAMDGMNVAKEIFKL